MSWIQPISMNMDLSRALVEGEWDDSCLATLQKVALFAIIPFMLIAAFEAVVKNLLCIQTLNCAIALLNAGHNLFYQGYDCFRH